MNVLILNASPRKNGVTSALLTDLKKRINSAHHVEVVRIQELGIRPCAGCLKCRPDKICVLPEDDSHHLSAKIKETDLIVIGSPVYWGNMPGTLKTFFDRNVPLFEYCEAKAIKYFPKPQLKGKKAILIISGGSPFPYNLLQSQSKGAIRSLKTVLKSGGINIISVLNVPDTYNFEKNKKRYFNKIKRLASSI